MHLLYDKRHYKVKRQAKNLEKICLSSITNRNLHAYPFQIEKRMVIAWGKGVELWESLLEMDGGDGCTTVCMH